jgi:hypothetical protein
MIQNLARNFEEASIVVNVGVGCGSLKFRHSSIMLEIFLMVVLHLLMKPV